MMVCQHVERGAGEAAHDTVRLTYEGRFLRRKRLITESGLEVLLDLEQVTSLNAGDALVAGNGQKIAIVAAEEELVAVTGETLLRYAWHIGNRHTPCQIEVDRLLIARDHVLEAMLEQLGATCTHVTEAFTPEGGAYGHGRTMGHSHGHSHDHDHEHGGGHTHAHD